MPTITAPYGFVPLSRTVVRPSWAQQANLHDTPLDGGLSGTLRLGITAETPIFTRGDRPDEFFTLDGTPAIPGTSVKGAIRNVVEIATFGWMDRVNKHRFAIRDLQNRALYGQYMAAIVMNLRTRKQEPQPLVNAGWLRRVKDDLTGDFHHEIEPCDFAKAEYAFLQSLGQRRGLQRFDLGRKQSSVDKICAWLETPARAIKEGAEYAPGKWLSDFAVTVAANDTREMKLGKHQLVSQFGKVDPLGKATKKGTLVFTGQPSEYKPAPKTDAAQGRRGAGHPKHHDFVFFEQTPKRKFVVNPKVFEDFEFAHSDAGQQHSLQKSFVPNEEWGFWERELNAPGGKVPVFFLANETATQITSFGLAMMYRLPYKQSTLEAVKRVQSNADAASRELDFAEGLFGTVRAADATVDGARALARKSRVFFGHAKADGKAQVERPVSAILSAPRASYYPNYVEQAERAPGEVASGSDGRADYQTWHEGIPRGWKRYRPKAGPFQPNWIPDPPTGADGKRLDLTKVGTTFKPLSAGTKFKADVVVHNVTRVELGALVWAVRLGDKADSQSRHMLGMARSLGFGRCRLDLQPTADLRDHAGAPVDLDACVAEFVAYMSDAERVPNWATSDAITELVALAKPAPAGDVRYQRLDPGRRVNEFVEGKKNGWSLARASERLGSGARGIPIVTPPTSAPPPRTPVIEPPRPPTSPQSAPAAAPPAPAVGDRGSSLRVKLVRPVAGGKWACAAADTPDVLGMIEGAIPKSMIKTIAAGAVLEVFVLDGSNLRNVRLSWMKPA